MTSLIRRLPFARLMRPHAATHTDAVRRASAPTGAAPVAPSPARANYPQLEERRGSAMRRLFPKLYSWCASRWESTMAMEVHAYLAEASSLEDLERRIRAVERGRHFSS